MAKLKGGTRIYGDIKIDGGIYDSSNRIGIGGSILISTGVGIAWTTSLGLQGTQGLQGPQATQGLQGTQGRQGIQGLQGPQATQGLQGSQGIQGIQGIQGPQATQGLQGTQGPQATQGVQGVQGPQATQGLQGTQGRQGIQGLQGPQATQGLQGTQGPQATQGIQGSNNGGVTVVNDVSTNSLRYIAFEDITSGISTNVGISSTKLVFNPSTGNLGIGTTNPKTKLEISGVLGFTNTNIAIGDTFTGGQLTSGALDNILIGSGVGYPLTTGDYNTIIGPYAAFGITSADIIRSVIIGSEAAREASYSISNVIIGEQAGYSVTGNTSQSVLIGYRAGFNQDGFSNVILGESAGYSVTGNNNIIMGFQAGYSVTSNDNVILGNSAGVSHTTGNGNVFLGFYAGGESSIGSYNIMLGYESGSSTTFTSGDGNIFLGYRTGVNQNSGSNNVAIGYNVNVPNPNGNNQLAVGVGLTNWITGNSSYNVGIGTTNPGEKLQVSGNLRLGGSDTSNYIAFRGTTGDNPGGYDHTYIGERIWSSSERSELFLFKGNDAISGSNSGPDRIRFAAGEIRLDTYTSPLSGTFENVAGSGLLNTRFILQSTGEVLIGSATSTGTSSQLLQVTGGAYVSGNFGIGNTNPGAKLDVSGDIRLSSADPEIEFNSGGPRLKVPSANTLTIHTGGGLNTATSEVVRINTTGVGINNTNPQAPLQIEELAFDTTTTTTTSTAQVAVDTFATATFRSAKYHVQLTCPGQIATLGGITTGGRGYTAGTYNVNFTTSSGTGSAAQGTLTISNGTVGQISVVSGGINYTAGDVLTASGGSGLQVAVGSTDGTGAILTLGSITSPGTGYTGYYNATTGTGTTTLTFLGGTGSGATGLATIFDGAITGSTLLQQPITGTGGTIYYSGSNYSTTSVLSADRTSLTNTITTITGSVGVSTFTTLTAHGIGVSDVIRTSSTSNGLTAGTDYYVVTVPSTTTFTLGTSVGIGTTFTAGTTLSINFYRNSAANGGQVAYTNAITGVSTNYQVSDLLVLQNGSTVDYVEYAGIANNDILGNFAADISGANARLLLTPTYPNNNVKVARQVMTV